MTAAISAILRYVSLIFGIVTGIQSAQSAQATAADAATILSDTTQIKLKVNDSTFGLAAIKDKLDEVSASLAGFILTAEADLDAIQATLAAGVPIGSVGSGALDDIGDKTAASVWGQQLSFTTNTTLDAVETAYTFAKRFGYSGAVTTYFDRKFLISGSGWWNPVGVDPPLISWTADPSHILADDDVLTWLQRETDNDPIWTIGNDGYPVWSDPDNPNWEFVLPWTEDYFELVKRHFLSASSVAAPVWPGLAGVTLGDPVALDVGLTVTGPMDGVLIAIDTYPAKQGFFTFDTSISLRNAGGIAFVSDNGDEEFPQLLGFLNAVYCPTTMQHAAGVVVRCAADLTGTITPFTIN